MEGQQMSTHNLRVGAIQMDCQPGQVPENLHRAVPFVEQAAERGAQIVLLPELMPEGYCLTETLWDSAEPLHGPTVAWLTALAGRLGVYLGTTFLEADGEDFYNTFVLMAPDGQLAGRVRKSPPASLEAYFFRAGDDAHVLETALGRIGVGICYENLLFERLRHLYQAGVDLVLQPTAAGRVTPMIPGDDLRFDRMVRRVAPFYARTLGVPVVLANRCGRLHTPLPAGMGELDSCFPGQSSIVDGDGAVKAKLGKAEGVIVADVRLDPALKGQRPLRDHGEMWAVPVPWYAFIWPMTQALGEQAYAQNTARKERALAIGKAPVSDFKSARSRSE
jgi:N-carbamoylputrescine amidase